MLCTLGGVLINREEITMQMDDFQWFIDNYQSLFSQFGNSYLAIKDKKVIGTYDSFAEAVKKTAESHPLGSFIVQQCNGSASAYTTYIASMNFV